jgi:hypothetical protein
VSEQKPRRAGEPAAPSKKPGLRLVKSPDERPVSGPGPDLKAMLDDMKRRYRVQRERAERDPEGDDAA